MEKDPAKKDPPNPSITKVAPDHLPAEPQATQLPPPLSQEEIQVLMQALRAIKRPLSSAPTNTPLNLLQQFELYENGTTRRIYFWVAGTWRYAALT